jgi:peptidoglycan LD-endopeptidase LytH
VPTNPIELIAERLGFRGGGTPVSRLAPWPQPEGPAPRMARTHGSRSTAGALAIVLTSFGVGIGPATAASPGPTTTVAGPAAPGSPPATPAPSDAEIAAKRAQVEQARVAAATAAKEYTDSMAELAHLDEQVATLEKRIPRLEARIKVLKDLLAQRAAVLYRGGEQPGLTVLDEVTSTGDLLAGGRIARLADAAQQSTNAQMQELDHSKKQLETDRNTMRAARAHQQDLVAETNKKAQVLEAALSITAGQLQVAEAQQSLERYLAALAAQHAAAEAAAAAAAAAGAPPPPPPVEQKPPADPALAARIPVMDLLCPVDGTVTFSDDFGQPRSGWRVHQGTDIFAPRGTPDVAIADGIAKISPNTLGGNAIWLYTADGNAYYYAHLDAYEGVFNADGVRGVRKGEVIGYVGNTGNAAGGPTHTHFEVHPGNIGPINPYPLLREMCAVQAGLRPPDPVPPVPDPNAPTTTTTTIPNTPTTNR